MAEEESPASRLLQPSPISGHESRQDHGSTASARLSAAPPTTAPASPRPAVARGVAGTLPPEARRYAAEFLHSFPPAELPLRVDELGGLLAGRGDGVLLVYAFDDRL